MDSLELEKNVNWLKILLIFIIFKLLQYNIIVYVKKL